MKAKLQALFSELSLSALAVENRSSVLGSKSDSALWQPSDLEIEIQFSSTLSGWDRHLSVILPSPCRGRRYVRVVVPLLTRRLSSLLGRGFMFRPAHALAIVLYTGHGFLMPPALAMV